MNIQSVWISLCVYRVLDCFSVVGPVYRLNAECLVYLALNEIKIPSDTSRFIEMSFNKSLRNPAVHIISEQMASSAYAKAYSFRIRKGA